MANKWKLFAEQVASKTKQITQVSGKALKEASQKGIELGRVAKQHIESSFEQTKAYLESEQFEQHLDEFAKKIEIDFAGSKINQVTKDLLKSDSRKIRITTKVKIIAQQCANEVGKASAKGNSLGAVTATPQIMIIATSVFGSAKAASLFYSALCIVRAANGENDNGNQSEAA